MTFQIIIAANFDDYATALEALRDCEEIVGKANGETVDTAIRDDECDILAESV